jgi:4-alpha-glucanotransferase
LTDARLWGVQQEFHDAAGRLVQAPPDTVAAALRELGAGDAEQPPPPGALILHPGDRLAHPLEVVTEDGRELRLDRSVPEDFPLGYHTVAGAAAGRLIVSPRRCQLPPALRLGGWAVQLYAARTRSSWGIGDLADLRSFGEWASAGGAGFVLLNPLNAAALSPAIEPSPYLPSSRRWRNPLYLRVEEVPGCAELGAELAPLVAAGRALNTARLIDREAVAALKLDALARIEPASAGSSAFRAWRRRQGEDLELFATFSVIAEEHGGDYRTWPRALHEPGGEAVAAVRRRSRGRIRFHAWLQWLLDRQLARAAGAVPLMTDLPVGVAPGGADVWADRELFATSVSVGAPPDLFNSLGQDWSQPPWNPWQLRRRGYAPLASVLRAGFAHTMGLRIDHVMGLFRLFWIPHGTAPEGGVFVRYPADDMLDILALESVRARALVVGEDLGTVEPVVREEMAARNILSYRLLWFEEGEPSTFPERALAAVTTHDLPTVAGLWTGADAMAQGSGGLPVNEAAMAELRGRLERVAGDPGAPVAEVIVSAYAALARCPSMLVAAALDDAAAVVERPNMPGTTGERWPNWRLALPQPLDELLASPLATRLAEILAWRRPLSRRGGGRRGPAQS